MVWLPTVSNLADILVRCTGLLQGKDEPEEDLVPGRRPVHLLTKTSTRLLTADAFMGFVRLSGVECCCAEDKFNNFAVATATHMHLDSPVITNQKDVEVGLGYGGRPVLKQGPGATVANDNVSGVDLVCNQSCCVCTCIKYFHFLVNFHSAESVMHKKSK